MLEVRISDSHYSEYSQRRQQLVVSHMVRNSVSLFALWLCSWDKVKVGRGFLDYCIFELFSSWLLDFIGFIQLQGSIIMGTYGRWNFSLLIWGSNNAFKSAEAIIWQPLTRLDRSWTTAQQSHLPQRYLMSKVYQERQGKWLFYSEGSEHELTKSVYGIKSSSSRELEEYFKRLFVMETSGIIGTIKEKHCCWTNERTAAMTTSARPATSGNWDHQHSIMVAQ